MTTVGERVKDQDSAHGSHASTTRRAARRSTILSRALIAIGAVVLVVGLVAGSFYLFSDDDAGDKDAAQFSGDGTYSVPNEMPPGLYRTPGGPECRWERRGIRPDAPDPTRAKPEVLARGEQPEASVVGVHKTDTSFTTSGCGMWTRIRQAA